MKNLTGQKFGRLTARTSYKSGRYIYWKCYCDCGNSHCVRQDALIAGQVKSCGCLSTGRKSKDYSGQKFGLLTVIKRDSKYRTNGNNRWMLLCRCDCGNETIVRTDSLLSGTTKSCGCLLKENHSRRTGFQQISGTYWNRVRYGAKVRGKEFTITIEEAWKLYLQQNKLCALSGEPIILSHNRTQTASLDRIDSNVGYITGNIQWVHKDVNRMKHTLKQNRFLELCYQITNKNRR